MGEEPWRRKGEQMESGGQDIDGYCGQLSRTQTSVNIEALEKHSISGIAPLKTEAWITCPLLLTPQRVTGHELALFLPIAL